MYHVLKDFFIKFKLYLFSIMMLLPGVFLFYLQPQKSQTLQAQHDEHRVFGVPDVIINTSSIFDLPRDLTKIPFLQDMLTEDFVNYYQTEQPDILSFKGTLTRFAFEKKIDWQLKLTSLLMNGPAEVSLWKGKDGTLKHFLLAVERTGIKEIASIVLQSIADDSQITVVKEMEHTIQINLSSGMTLFMMFNGNKVYLFNHGGIGINPSTQEASIKSKLMSFFGMQNDVSILGSPLGSAKHIITANMNFLSFGYQAFFSDLTALKMSFENEQWQSFVQQKHQSVEGAELLWKSVPHNAALCANVAMDFDKVEAVIAAGKWLKQSKNLVMACWYGDSKLYTPLFAIRGEFTELLKNPDSLQEVFETLIGSREVIVEKITIKKEVTQHEEAGKAGSEEGSDEDKSEKVEESFAFKYLEKLPVEIQKDGNHYIHLTREVGARYGIYESKESKYNSKLGSKRYFKVKLVATATAIFFSPDDRLVDQALLTIGEKFPSMAATLPPHSLSAIASLNPNYMEKLISQSILETLPENQEMFYRNALAQSFFPNLEKFGKRPMQVGVLQGDGEWKKIDWRANEKK